MNRPDELAEVIVQAIHRYCGNRDFDIRDTLRAIDIARMVVERDMVRATA